MFVDAHKEFIEVAEEAVRNGKVHVMDSRLISRLSFPEESVSTFFILELPSSSQLGFGECSDVSPESPLFSGKDGSSPYRSVTDRVIHEVLHISGSNM